MIYGRWHVDDNKPTVMIYAHYDVQPPDPLDQWISPPFEPQTRDGKIYARGVADDKGGLFATLLAVEALGKKAGGPPINLVFFYEGEEESGSPSVTPFLERESERWACDVVVSADGLMWDEDNYSLILSSKGMAGGQIDIFTADIDAHSGIYGATVHNAADVTARIAASFHDANGKIAVQGFYDEVLPVTEQQVAEIEAVPFDEKEFLGRLGATATWGEPDYSTLERAWLRPTLDINGIWSGYLGDGGKTVTPSQGHIKITCRLVPDQDPQAIIELIRMHVQTHLPAGCRAEFQFKIGTAQPFFIDARQPVPDSRRGNAARAGWQGPGLWPHRRHHSHRRSIQEAPRRRNGLLRLQPRSLQRARPQRMAARCKTSAPAPSAPSCTCRRWAKSRQRHTARRVRRPGAGVQRHNASLGRAWLLNLPDRFPPDPGPRTPDLRLDVVVPLVHRLHQRDHAAQIRLSIRTDLARIDLVFLHGVRADMNFDPGHGERSQMGAQVIVTGKRVNRRAIDHHAQARLRPLGRQIIQIGEHIRPVLLLGRVQAPL